ncbi:hypothetical protein PbDSM24746_44150 [Paenibacillus macerans]|nr:hypothetical protein PbDSM24746_44150 [Paenibacillus macerans]GBK70975.1 hypothetical protein PbJCM17693_46830 [Paenibacillus macerans]GIP09817.1 hypothetical protein J1TS5_19870 [Paenibacillus macerans]
MVSLPAACLCTIIPFVKEQRAGVGARARIQKKREEKNKKDEEKIRRFGCDF